MQIYGAIRSFALFHYIIDQVVGLSILEHLNLDLHLCV